MFLYKTRRHVYYYMYWLTYRHTCIYYHSYTVLRCRKNDSLVLKPFTSFDVGDLYYRWYWGMLWNTALSNTQSSKKSCEPSVYVYKTLTKLKSQNKIPEHCLILLLIIFSCLTEWRTPLAPQLGLVCPALNTVLVLRMCSCVLLVSHTIQQHITPLF